MKGKLIGGMIFMITLLLLGSCCDHEMYQKKQFKYKIGEFIHHRVSEDKILIVDTIRDYDCLCDDGNVELMYRGINSSENENVYKEVELKP